MGEPKDGVTPAQKRALTPTQQRAVDQVFEKNDLKKDVAVIRTYGTVPFLDGTLTTINYKNNDQELEWQENYYYEANNDNQFFFVAQDLAEFVSRHPRLRRSGLIERTLTFAGISGVIALIITLVISFLVLFETVHGITQFSVPEILANALTTILGFYFGTATQRQASNP